MKNLTFRTIMLKGAPGNSIKQIDKISASGGVMQMRITLTDDTTVDFPVNDVPDENLIHNIVALDTQDIRAELAEVTTLISITLLANNWNDYEYTAAITGVTADDNYEIIGFTPTNDIDLDMQIKEQLGYIVYGVCGAGEITFIAGDDVPDVDLPIILRKVVGAIS